MLSVFERTHEIGLLRAVGMKRRQIRAMIRSESVILAVFGAVIGIIVGTLLGIALAWSLRSQGITRHRRARVEPRDLPGPGRLAGSARRQLAGAPRSETRRPRGHRRRVTPASVARNLHGGRRLEIGPGEIGRQTTDQRLEIQGKASLHETAGLGWGHDLVCTAFTCEFGDTGAARDRRRPAAVGVPCGIARGVGEEVRADLGPGRVRGRPRRTR